MYMIFDLIADDMDLRKVWWHIVLAKIQEWSLKVKYNTAKVIVQKQKENQVIDIFRISQHKTK